MRRSGRLPAPLNADVGRLAEERAVIEPRIKRALWAVSILTALGFGGYGAYQFFDAYQIDIAAQQWHDLNDKWYSETCGRTELDSAAMSVCNDAWRMRAYYSYGPNRAREEGATSLAVAVAIPVALWSLFLLLRWIWIGRNQNSQPLVSPGLKMSSESQAQTSMNWIDLAYKGHMRLWKVFWFGYVAPLLPLSVAFQLYKETADRLPSWVGVVGFLVVFVYQVWLAIALWRCAPNVNRPGFRRLGRAFAVFVGLLTLAAARAFLVETP